MSIANTKKRSIAIGSDHGGFTLKEKLGKYLTEQQHWVKDCGTFSTEAVDYPKFAALVAQNVAEGKVDFGIIIDGAGIGSSMTANKIPGVRAAMCYDLATARNAREHNNANVLTLGAGFLGFELAVQIVEIFISHQCSVDRHLRRVQMINDLDCNENQGIALETADPCGAKNNDLNNLTNDDISRIAERVGQLLSSQNIISSETNSENPQSDMVSLSGVCVERQPETIRKFMDFGVQRIGYHNGTGCECVPEDIARCIDHTILKPDATADDIKRICAEAREFQFASVCISPSYVKLAGKELDGSPVKVCTVIGFPSGAHVPEIKALEARQAIREGAKEIDMVINVGALKSGDDDLVYHDIRKVTEACEDGSAKCKVIIEAALLTDDEKVRACKLAKKARANYVKTSTGFGPGGATAEDVALMSQIVHQAGIGVKAAGGISSFEDAKKMISAGATRLGASAGIKILHQSKSVSISK